MLIKQLEKIKTPHLLVFLTYSIVVVCDILFTETIDETFIILLVLIWIIIIKFMKIKGTITLTLSITLFLLSLLMSFTSRDTLLEKTFSYSFIFFVFYNIQTLIESNSS